MRPRPFTVLFLLAAMGGFFFLSYATYDFAQHLDRQVHGIHCSFNPLAATDATGSTGCHTTLMSPYSSVFRTALWGGLPISLPGMAVFAFLLYRGLDILFNSRQDDRDATRFLAIASVLPVLTSLVMGYLSMVELGAFCKLCIGTYVSSFAAFIAALLMWRSAAAPQLGEDIGLGSYGYGASPAGDLPSTDTPASGSGLVGIAVGFAILSGFVAVPSLAYLILAPDFSGYIGACGELTKPEDTYNIMFPLDENTGGKVAIEVFDPLCPACKGFEARMEASGLDAQLQRKAVLFPLDSTCNWNVGGPVHAGACTVSEAILCAEGRRDAVIDWAFAHQDDIRRATETDPKAAGSMVLAEFPELKSCLGSAAVKTKLNRSMRWVVNNGLPVLTPQLYVEGKKLCDEDTDLGMDWALSRLLVHAETPGANKPVEVTP